MTGYQVKGIKGVKDLCRKKHPVGASSIGSQAVGPPAMNFNEIRIPIFEVTTLFARSIGASTDIVEKEMYTFQDRDGTSLTLRPEGTAGTVRALYRANRGAIPVPRSISISGPCFATSGRKQAACGNFISSASNRLGWLIPKLTSRSLPSLANPV